MMSPGRVAVPEGMFSTTGMTPTTLTPGFSLATEMSSDHLRAMRQFSRDIGLAFQIRDDILDVQGETDVIGKPAGSDQASKKATWPALFGIEESNRRCSELLNSAMHQLAPFGDSADSLRNLASLIVERIK